MTSLLGRMSYLMSIQVFTRGITFILNILVAREVGPVVFGLQSVNLYLLYTLLLFFSREGLRRAVMRHEGGTPKSEEGNDPSNKHSLPQPRESRGEERREVGEVINLAWFCCAICALILSPIFITIFQRFPPQALSEAPSSSLAQGYQTSVVLYSLSAVVEMCGEPLYVVAQLHLLVRTRVAVEGFAVVLKCLVTYLLVLLTPMTLLAFAWAQLAYSLAVTAGYFLYFATQSISVDKEKKSSVLFGSIREMFPRRFRQSDRRTTKNDSASWLALTGWMGHWTNLDLLGLASTFTIQSVMKFFLTEGEKVVLMGFQNNLEEVGVYGLINNLGSLVARFLFQPVEESCYAEFSLLLKKKSSDPCSNNEQSRKRAQSVLFLVCQLMTCIGLVFVFFGPHYASTFLQLLYGQKWATGSGPILLSWYCLYVLTMATNGVTESFLFAAASTSQLRLYNYLLVGFSATYILASIFLMHVGGTAGLIWANCVNMAARTLYSTNLIKKFFNINTNANALTSLFPVNNVWIMAPLVLASGVIWAAKMRYNSDDWATKLGLIAVGAVMIGPVALGMWRTYKHEFARIKRRD